MKQNTPSGGPQDVFAGTILFLTEAQYKDRQARVELISTVESKGQTLYKVRAKEDQHFRHGDSFFTDD